MSLPGMSGSSSAGSGAASIDIGDDVAYSLMLDSASSQYLSRTQTTSGTWTLSVWVKRAKLSAAMGVLEGAGFLYNAGDTITAGALTTTAVYRDPGAWVHVHISNNGLYVGGVYLGAVTTGVLTNPDIGRNSTSYFDGYLADLIFLDNDTVAYTSFGRVSADLGPTSWVHKTYAGSYTAGSYRLDFANSADLGNDVSGNNNDWTTNGGISSSNQYTDTPTNNYCVWNALVPSASLTVGNTKAAASTVARGTIAPTSSMLAYWEITSTGGTTTAGMLDGTDTATATTTITTGVTKGFRFDAGNGTFDWTTDGSSWTSITTGLTSGPYKPYVSTAAATTATINAGSKAWIVGGTTPPTGYSALCTANLPDHAIPYGAAHFNAKIRTGTGASYSVTGEEFQPDLVWTKGRSGVTDHALYDIVRGVQKQIESNTTAAETTETTGLTAFNSDGYSAGALAQMNTNAATYVDWMWKAGNSAGSSNTNGSITSTVSANTTAGISVVKYTGTGANATVGHGLSTAPKLVIVKHRSSATDWIVSHSSLTSGAYFIKLNATDAQASAATVWNSTFPSSTVISLGSNSSVNDSGNSHVAYCFAEIEGFSKFGSYTGNASADGTFIYCGFKPRWIMTKCSSTTGDWRIYDAVRPGYNVQGGTLLADTAGAETTTAEMDITSNGFKCRITTDPNSAQTFIYAAFADLPLKYAASAAR